MRDLLTTLKILAVVLLVPVVPFLFFGGYFEAWLGHWKSSPPDATTTAMVIVGLLATDILLPIPSSVISTLAGSQLGVVGGTAAVCLGMTLGATLGFALAKRWGRTIALRFAKEEDLDRLEKLTSLYGATVLVLFRAVPVLAEASVLLVGIHKLSWKRFLPPLVFSNLGIALAYAKFGEYADRNQWLPFALGISVALPLLLTMIVRHWLLAAEKRNNPSEAAK
jgi:membrane protein DedA with SNARE-associated domain